MTWEGGFVRGETAAGWGLDQSIHPAGVQSDMPACGFAGIAAPVSGCEGFQSWCRFAFRDPQFMDGTTS